MNVALHETNAVTRGNVSRRAEIASSNESNALSLLYLLTPLYLYFIAFSTLGFNLSNGRWVNTKAKQIENC
jgi:hypothetical protein